MKLSMLYILYIECLFVCIRLRERHFGMYLCVLLMKKMHKFPVFVRDVCLLCSDILRCQMENIAKEKKTSQKIL